MSFTVVADIHLDNHRQFGGVARSGLNQRARLIIDVLEHLFQQTDKQVAVLGDVFDTRPSPQLLAAFGLTVRRRMCDSVTLIVGNHDHYSDHDGDHALGVFNSMHRVVVFGSESHWAQGVMWHGYRASPARSWLMKEIQQHPDRVHFAHVGIADDSTPPWLRNGKDVVWAEEVDDALERGMLVAGNWHEHKLFGHNIIQVGALVPTGFDNPSEFADLLQGKDHYGTVLDLERTAFQRSVLCGPRFMMMHPDEHNESELIEGCAKLFELGYQPFIRFKVASKEVNNARDLVTTLIEKQCIMGGDVVVTQEARIKESVKRTAVTKEGVDHAVASYVANVTLPTGVQADEVIRAVKGFIK